MKSSWFEITLWINDMKGMTSIWNILSKCRSSNEPWLVHRGQGHGLAHFEPKCTAPSLSSYMSILDLSTNSFLRNSLLNFEIWTSKILFKISWSATLIDVLSMHRRGFYRTVFSFLIIYIITYLKIIYWKQSHLKLFLISVKEFLKQG